MDEKTTNVQSININTILVSDRIRIDLGDIDKLAESIKEFGLLQPIILDFDYTGDPAFDKIRLVIGGRRLAAMKKLGIIKLIHGVHFLCLGEENSDPLRKQAVELEENLRRKELTWQEQVSAKQKLLETMKAIYGEARPGAPSRWERLGLVESGFGVNKLAAMLGESAALTSKDLTLASMLTNAPALANAATKESAMRLLRTTITVVKMKTNAAKLPSGAPRWTLYKGDFRLLSNAIPNESVDLIYTDLPFGVSLSEMSKHDKGVAQYADDRDSIVSQLADLASISHRVLRNDRFGVFFFGFNYYSQLLAMLQSVGFVVNPVPVIWYKHTRSTENPNTRYANAYDAALVVSKGSPLFIRPGQTNVVDIPAITSSERLQIAQQPTLLVKRFLGDMAVEGATVVDWCAGSGTTGVAALELGMSPILFEREPSAHSLIEARCAQAQSAIDNQKKENKNG